MSFNLSALSFNSDLSCSAETALKWFSMTLMRDWSKKIAAYHFKQSTGKPCWRAGLWGWARALLLEVFFLKAVTVILPEGDLFCITYLFRISTWFLSYDSISTQRGSWTEKASVAPVKRVWPGVGGKLGSLSLIVDASDRRDNLMESKKIAIQFGITVLGDQLGNKALGTKSGRCSVWICSSSWFQELRFGS